MIEEKSKPRVLLAIPSKARSNPVQKYVGRWLKKSDLFDTVLFVEPQEILIYEMEVKIPHKKIHCLPANNMGLGYATSQIERYANENEYEFIFKMDDDVSGFCGQTRRLDVPNSHAILEKAILDGLEAFDKHQTVAAIGYPYRGEMWEYKKWLRINARLQTCYFIRTIFFNGDSCISTFEDFGKTLSIISKQQKILRYGYMGINLAKGVGHGVGGCQAFDRHEQAMQEAQYLKTLYPWLTFKKVSNKAWPIEPVFKNPTICSKSIYAKTSKA